MTVNNVVLLRRAAFFFAALVIGFTVWLIVRPDPRPATQDQESKASPTQAGVEKTMLSYCRTTYRANLQKSTGAQINPDDITLTNYNAILDGDYARIAMECHTDAIDIDESLGGFTAFLQYKKKAWSIYKTSSQSPPCKDFDNKDWPVTVMSECYDPDIGTMRDAR